MSDEEDSAPAEHVWLQVSDSDAWSLCRIERRASNGTVTLRRSRAPDGVKFKVEVDAATFAKLSPAVNADSIGDVDDLTQLEDTGEGTMLHALRARYERNEIFTAIGPVCLVINPYQSVPCCQPAKIAELAAHGTSDGLPPHLLGVAASAYYGLVERGELQSIAISGESGAGKTESAKICLSCLAMVSRSEGVQTERALEAGVLLETFGNARTVYNHNSSRFGKWCEVHFDRHGRIGSCRLDSFLLETTRVSWLSLPTIGNASRLNASYGASEVLAADVKKRSKEKRSERK